RRSRRPRQPSSSPTSWSRSHLVLAGAGVRRGLGLLGDVGGRLRVSGGLRLLGSFGLGGGSLPGSVHLSRCFIRLRGCDLPGLRCLRDSSLLFRLDLLRGGREQQLALDRLLGSVRAALAPPPPLADSPPPV